MSDRSRPRVPEASSFTAVRWLGWPGHVRRPFRTYFGKLTPIMEYGSYGVPARKSPESMKGQQPFPVGGATSPSPLGEEAILVHRGRV